MSGNLNKRSKMSNTSKVAYSFSEVLERTTRRLMGSSQSAFNEEDKLKIKCALRAYLLPSHLKTNFETDQLDDWNCYLTTDAAEFLKGLAAFDKTDVRPPKAYSIELLGLATEREDNFNLKFEPSLKFSRARIPLARKASKNPRTSLPSWDEDNSFPRLVKKKARQLLGDSLYESLRESANPDDERNFLIVTNAIRHSMMKLDSLSSTQNHKPFSDETLSYSQFKRSATDDSSLSAYADYVLFQNDAISTPTDPKSKKISSSSIYPETYLQMLLAETPEKNHFDIQTAELKQLQDLIPFFEEVADAFGGLTPNEDGTISTKDIEHLVSTFPRALTAEALSEQKLDNLKHNFTQKLTEYRQIASQKTKFLADLKLSVINILQIRKDQAKPFNGIDTYAEYFKAADDKPKSLLGYLSYLITKPHEDRRLKNLAKRKEQLCEISLEKFQESAGKYKDLLEGSKDKVLELLMSFKVNKPDDLLVLRTRLKTLPSFNDFVESQRQGTSRLERARRRFTTDATKFNAYFDAYCIDIHLKMSASIHTDGSDTGSEASSQGVDSPTNGRPAAVFGLAPKAPAIVSPTTTPQIPV